MILLIAIVALGAYLRFSQLAETPAEPTSDHAEKLLDVRDLLNGERPIYFDRNTGREPIQFYFTAFVLIRGLNMPLDYETLKYGMAALDTLSIVALFLLARELAGNRAGLIAAFLHATAAWATINGVFGLRPSMGPLTAALALWLFFRWIRTRDPRDALWTGLAIGIGLYGYTAFRTVPIAIALGITLVVVAGRKDQTRGSIVAHAGLMASMAGLVFIPMGHFVVQNWDTFWSRTSSRTSPGAEDSLGILDRIVIFAENNIRSLGMFTWQGDNAWVNFAPHRPALDYLTGTAFLVGLVAILLSLKRGPDLRWVIVLLAIPVLLLSSSLAIAFQNEVPSFSRSFLVAPLAMTIAAVGLDRMSRATNAHFGWLASRVILGAWMVLSVRANAVLVDEYDHNYRATVPNTYEIARVIDAARMEFAIPLIDVYLLNVPFWLDHRNVAFALHDFGWGETNEIWIDETLPSPPADGPELIVFNPTDVDRLTLLFDLYPDGTVLLADSDREGKDFGLFLTDSRLPDVTQLAGVSLIPFPIDD